MSAQTDLVQRLEQATARRDAADAEIVALLVEARAMKPPVPLTALAEATGVSESAVSIRLTRLKRSTEAR